MKKIKVLNLYACLGGNRYKWDEVANIEVTAVELDTELAKLYQERFPNDKVIIADAHQFLLEHYKEFDFIWSSPPCPTHSRARYWNSSNYDTKTKAVYPDMKLYQEILFLDNYFKGHYVVENVIPFYNPLIPAKKRGRHLYWTNFKLPVDINNRTWKDKDDIAQLSEMHEYDFKKYKGIQRINKIARNLVDYEAGKTIFKTAVRVINGKPLEQIGLFQESDLSK